MGDMAWKKDIVFCLIVFMSDHQTFCSLFNVRRHVIGCINHEIVVHLCSAIFMRLSYYIHLGFGEKLSSYMEIKLWSIQLWAVYSTPRPLCKQKQGLKFLILCKVRDWKRCRIIFWPKKLTHLFLTSNYLTWTIYLFSGMVIFLEWSFFRSIKSFIPTRSFYIEGDYAVIRLL